MIGKTITGGAPAAFACLCLATAGVASGQDVFNIDEPSDLAEIDGTDTLNILDGGEVGEVFLTDENAPNFDVSFVARDQSTVNVFDGGQLGRAFITDDATLNIFDGGTYNGNFRLFLSGNSQSFVAGGIGTNGPPAIRLFDFASIEFDSGGSGPFIANGFNTIVYRNGRFSAGPSDIFASLVGPNSTLLVEDSSFDSVEVDGRATFIRARNGQSVVVRGQLDSTDSDLSDARVEANGNATFAGDTFYLLEIADSGTVSLDNVTVSIIEAADDSFLRIGGGTTVVNLTASNQATVVATGGLSDSAVMFENGTTLLIGGSDFSLDGVEIDIATFTEDDPFIIDERGGALLAGTLFDGTSFQLTLDGSFSDSATLGLFGLTAIPSPTAAGTGLALFGLLGLNRRRNRA